ncbi:glycerophosphoryl diester phosphodiesterase membrane domain-containing protein [Microbacterium sp. A84]|uniref:glycerophosphoryl diester phosphodiesterase membrane domain-containing protein n=1 Tax=Microbacterium sp. A84 TaxID=3450715 RepID=UPI003F43DBEC
MSAQIWTPAPKPGLIPLHPLTFGALLGKPFAALRHNPKVLFGFAIVVQLIVAAITVAVVGAVVYGTFLRMESLSPSSPDFYPVLWGSIAINAIVAIAMSLVSVAFTAIMQGIVAANIGYAALGEKPSLGTLWRRMRPALWRLIGWSLLQALAALVLIAIVGGIIALGVLAGAGGSAEGVGLTVVVGILLVLGMIPLGVWLNTKLLLVPSVLVLEGVSLREGLVRSWRLTRGRFWNTFAVILLVSLIMNTAVGLVSVPLSLIGSLFGSIIAPTGPNDASEIGAYLLTAIAPQLLIYVLQAVAIVVQCAAAAFIYLDCRMRYEGLDHSLISYLERRDRGATAEQLGDPFAVDPARAVSSAPPQQQTPAFAAAPVGWAQYPPQGYPAAQPYPQQAYPAAPPYPAAQPYSPQQQNAPYVGATPPPPAPQTPVPPAAQPIPPSSESPWAPPGSGSA